MQLASAPLASVSLASAPLSRVAPSVPAPSARPAPDAPLAGRALHDLAAWQGAMELAVACHGLTRGLPAEATELAASIRQAATDVAVHVAQGHDRLLPADFADHLAVARGALSRLATHLEIARRLRLVDDAAAGAIAGQSAEVARRIGRLVRALYGIGGPRPPTGRGAAGR